MNNNNNNYHVAFIDHPPLGSHFMLFRDDGNKAWCEFFINGTYTECDLIMQCLWELLDVQDFYKELTAGDLYALGCAVICTIRYLGRN